MWDFICLERSRAKEVISFSDLSFRSDEFRIISWEVATADDKISDLSARDDGFRASAGRLQLQMIRYRTYRPEMMVTVQ